MNRSAIWSVLLPCLLLAACAEVSQEYAGLEPGESAGFGGGEAERIREKDFAYSHSLHMEMHRSFVAARFERARDLCLEDTSLNCSVLQSSVSGSGEERGHVLARLQVRLPHTQIPKYDKALRAPLEGEAEDGVSVVSYATDAEDLGGPIVDNEQRLAQLKDYLDRLQSLAGREDLSVDDLIKIAKERSQTQSQIEAISGTYRDLRERVDRDTLNIRLTSRYTTSDRLSEQWHDMLRAVPESAIAMLGFVLLAIPWLPVVAAGFVVLGLGWRLIRRMQGGRERQNA